MKTSTLVSLLLLFFVFGASQQVLSDQTRPDKDVVASPSKREVKKIEVTITPSEPYLLPDKSTELLIKNESLYEHRKHSGFPQLATKDLVLDIVPNTVIASGGYLFHLTMPHEYKFGHVRESDMIFTVVDSCKSTVLIEKGQAPTVELKGLRGDLQFACDNKQASQLKTIQGDGRHFVAVRVTRTEIYRKHPSPVLGTGMDVFVVNNFGAKKIRLEYMKEETVTIGPETITLESFDFDYPTKLVKIKVSTAPKLAKAEAFIVEYSNSKVGEEPAAELETKQDGKWKPAELPLPGLAEGKAVEVRVRGKLTHGIMAIGGETTGTIINFGRTNWELDLRRNPAFGPRAEKHNGKRVVVTGHVRQKAGVEIAKRTVLTIDSIDPVED